MNMNRKLFFAAFACLALTKGVSAAEIEAGTVLSSSNIDQLYEDTFEGHKVKDLLTEKMEWRIREQGYELPLVHSTPVVLSEAQVARAQQNVGNVTINREAGRVDGWVGESPFPNVNESDPEAGEKLVWNWYYGANNGDLKYVPKFAYVLIDGESGVERTQTWQFMVYKMKGRLTGEQVEGDGSELSRTIISATGPRDIKGLGTFSIRTDNAEVDDVWAYIKSVRRTRRLSGGAWMDPIGGTDQLQSDIEIFNANPTWYEGFRLLGKRHILTVAHGVPNNWGDSNELQNYSVMDSENAPYWNFNGDRYEPREVFVVEVTPPSEHPYSKKILYIDTEYPRIHMGEAYDKNGEFWKMFQFHSRPNVGEDGMVDIRTTAGVTIDFKRNHATAFFPDADSWEVNPEGKDQSDVSLSALRSSAR